MVEVISVILNGLKSSILAGAIYGIGTIGLSIIYKYLRFPDFTTIASMILGGIATIYISNHSNLLVGISISILICSFLGLITGLQIAYAKIPGILAGIITGTGAISLAFIFTRDITGQDGASVSFNGNIKPILEYIVPNTFNWGGLAELLFFLLFVCIIVSFYFKTKYGSYTLALLGTDHYLLYRHRKIKITQVLLLVFCNAIIGFAGSLFAIHENIAYVQGHQDFLIVAIGGYALGNFLLTFFSSKPMKGLLEKETKATSNFWMQFAQLVMPYLYLNDEDPKKIFCTLIFYSFSAMFINVIFKSVETIGDIGNYNYIFKAIILLGILLLSNWYNKLAKTFSNH